MRALITILAFAVAGGALAVEKTKIVVHPEEILKLRAIESEVEVTLAIPQSGELVQHVYPLEFFFPFRLPAHIRHDIWVGQTRWAAGSVTVRFKLKDAKAAATLAEFLEARRPNRPNHSLQPTAGRRGTSL
jgi:hypothetical protein